MKKVFISVTGVLRDTFSKASAEYRKYYLESELENEQEESFEYAMELPVNTCDISNHFKFQSEDELKYFFFIEFAMEIFGHSAPVYSGVFKDLSDFLKDNQDIEVTIVSDEVGKGKPATLFFLAKNSCYVDNYVFYKKDNIEEMWNNCDVWITSDCEVLSTKPEGKKVVKVKTEYNESLNSDYTVEKLADINDIEL
jgi:hypothetical protein